MANFNLTDQTNLFKINYYKKSENMYNSKNVLQGRIKKRYDFVGKQRFISVPLSFSGGVSSGSLPTANAGNYEGAIIVAKKVYARAEIDRESIKASKGDKGAFVEATKETVKKAVESYIRNGSRILYGDGSGILGRGDATGANVSGAGSSADPYVVIFPNDGNLWKEANWEEKDYVSMVTGMSAYPDNTGATAETSLLEVTEVTPETRTIKLVGTSVRLAALTGVGPLAATDGIAMQKSYENDPQGLMGISNAVVGTTSLYGITAQRRWKMEVQAKSGAGINPDMMNGIILNIEKKSDSPIDMIATSYTQYQKVLDFLEDQKVYNLPNKNLKGAPGFKGVEIMTSRGPIGMFVDRFCEDDRMYFLNSSRIEVHHRPGFGWFDDDGTVFMRQNDSDDYEARYGGYYENLIIPTGHGVLTGLAV